MTKLSFDPENTLSGKLHSMPPKDVIELGIDLCAAIDSGFGSSGCHGSIWPGNVSLVEGKAFIGPASKLSVKEMEPDALEYIAPEQFWNGENSPASDVYSVGLLLYTALNGGALPFFEGRELTAENRAAALQARMRGKDPGYPRTASRELGDLVLKAIAFRKEDRFENTAALKAALEALPEGAAVPAAVPVIPLSNDEVKSARSYKVDKEFEKTEAPKTKRVKKESPVDEEKELEKFRDNKPKRNLALPLLLIIVIIVAAMFALKSCSSEKPSLPLDPDVENTEEPVITQEPVSTPEPTPELTPEPTPEATPEVVEPTYQVLIEDVTWEQAKARCEELGGHLATVKNDADLAEMIALVEESGAKFVWLGAFRDSDNTWKYVTGEQMTYGVWDTNEPSAFDSDGTPENYLLMWHSRTRDIWCFNDTRNDPISVLPRTYSGKTAFICQFDC